MKYIERKFDSEIINIFPIGDLHIGAEKSFFDEALKMIEKAQQNDYFVLLGDLIDNNTKDSVGDANDMTIPIEKSIEIVQNMLKNYQKKILGVIAGNHELRTERKHGIEPLRIICSDLNIPYDENILVLDISVNASGHRGSARRTNFVIAIGHGYTSARTLGGRVNANARIMEVVNNADIYITAHTHTPSLNFEDYFEVDKQNKNIRQLKRALLTIPGFLGYSRYAERRFMKPATFVRQKIVLDGTSRKKVIKIEHEYVL